MAYYDRIAKSWHEATGYKGGPFKELVLNEVLLKDIPGIHDCSILELGAGNGYFLPQVLRRFSGQVPAAIVVTDQSESLLEVARKHFRIPNATYEVLDVRRPFPFQDNSVGLILATMMFNELTSSDARKALQECHRVLSDAGLFLMTVTHPDFIKNLERRGLLAKTKGGGLTMPGAGQLRLPVRLRSVEAYERALGESGFQFEHEAVFPSAEVLNVKSGLRYARGLPLALVFRCRKLQSGKGKAQWI